MLCILAVFIPAFFMVGAARALFVPMALAVAFAMVASYVLSSTLVPILSVWFLRGRGGEMHDASWVGALAGSEVGRAGDLEVPGSRVVRGEIHRMVTLPGTLRANQEATLYAKVSGYLKGVRVDRGDRVKAGDVFEVSKQSYAVGGALTAQVALGDAIYASLAARQRVQAFEHETEAVRREGGRPELGRNEALAGRALEAAEQTFRLTLERKAFGVGAVLEAVQAEEALTRARLEYVEVVARQNRAQFDLQAAIGQNLGP